MMEEKRMKKELMLVDKNVIESAIKQNKNEMRELQDQMEKLGKKIRYLTGTIDAWEMVLKYGEKKFLDEIAEMISKTSDKIDELLRKPGNQNEILQLIGYRSALDTIKNMFEPQP